MFIALCRCAGALVSLMAGEILPRELIEENSPFLAIAHAVRGNELVRQLLASRSQNVLQIRY